MDDLAVATVLMMIGGKVVLLRPQRAGQQEVRYDMQILADRIEFCWIHLRGIGTLENSLWGYDGRGMRVWLNALNIEAPSDSSARRDSVEETVNIPLDFYPLCAYILARFIRAAHLPLACLMDKGIMIGVEHDIASRSTLPFVLFRHTTSVRAHLVS